MRIILACLWLLPACLAGPVLADTHTGPHQETVERTIGGDRYAAGGDLSIGGAVEGDLIAGAGRLGSSATVSGDALVAGGDLQIGARIGRDLYAAGGDVRINAQVGRNARIAGGKVELGAQTSVGGNAGLAGGEIRIYGNVGGTVAVGAGSVWVDGMINGDVHAATDELTVGPNARIGGKLIYYSRNEARIDPAATIVGGVERRELDFERPPAEMFEFGPGLGAFGGVWTIGLIVLAALLIYAAPALPDAVTARVSEAAGASLLLGFVGLICIPIAFVLIAVTVIGIPVALLTLLGYFALLLLGYVTGAIAVGDLLLRRGRGPSRGWRTLAAAITLVVLALLAMVPFVGWIIGPLVMFAGIGALLQLGRHARRKRVIERL
ncbi:MAG: polymer-forming cytoskeletal protein [Burkholderiales bacterium]|nr:MAG: polymer-forming cytoskeletal protein [Burkholderiales bacterium]